MNVAWSINVPFLWLACLFGWRAGRLVQAAEGQGVQIRSAEEFCLPATPRALMLVRLAMNAAALLQQLLIDAIMRLRQPAGPPRQKQS